MNLQTSSPSIPLPRGKYKVSQTLSPFRGGHRERINKLLMKHFPLRRGTQGEEKKYLNISFPPQQPINLLQIIHLRLQLLYFCLLQTNFKFRFLELGQHFRYTPIFIGHFFHDLIMRNQSLTLHRQGLQKVVVQGF